MITKNFDPYIAGFRAHSLEFRVVVSFATDIFRAEAIMRGHQVPSFRVAGSFM